MIFNGNSDGRHPYACLVTATEGLHKQASVARHMCAASGPSQSGGLVRQGN